MEDVSNVGEPVAWIKVYHPSGLDVRMPVPLSYEVPAKVWSTVLGNVSNVLAAGWLKSAPDAVPGEEIEVVSYVVRTVHENDGDETPVIDLYSENERMAYPVLRVYLNTAEEVAAFEAVSGLKLNDLPKYIGTGRIERGKSRQMDQLVTRAPHVFRVAHLANPRHDPNETDVKKKKPKRKFSRWPDFVDAPAVPITEAQVHELDKLIVDTKADRVAFLGYFKVSNLEQMNSRQYAEAKSLLARKAKA